MPLERRRGLPIRSNVRVDASLEFSEFFTTEEKRRTFVPGFGLDAGAVGLRDVGRGPKPSDSCRFPPRRGASSAERQPKNHPFGLSKPLVGSRGSNLECLPLPVPVPFPPTASTPEPGTNALLFSSVVEMQNLAFELEERSKKPPGVRTVD